MIALTRRAKQHGKKSHESVFGADNVFIDIDLRAGEKFPKVLQRRLAQCKVMVAGVLRSMKTLRRLWPYQH